MKIGAKNLKCNRWKQFSTMEEIKMKKLTQKERVLNYMRTHKQGVTAFDGFEKLGITQVHTVIHELREDGHKIETNMTKNKKTGTYFARWTLAK